MKRLLTWLTGVFTFVLFQIGASRILSLKKLISGEQSVDFNLIPYTLCILLSSYGIYLIIKSLK